MITKFHRRSGSALSERSESKGFTLVELVIAMTIVVVLATIGFATFSLILKNNRDQQRTRDLNSLKQSLELYRSNNYYYPASLNLGCGINGQLSDNNQVYMDLPQDPICPSQSYIYLAKPTGCGTDCRSFILCAKSETARSFNPPLECTVLGSGPVCQSNPGDCDLGLSSD